MLWRKVTLIGVGLLGGSLGLALKKRALANHVHGYVRRESSVAECLLCHAVDSASTDLEGSVRDADLIVFCTPLAQMAALAKSFSPHVQPGALITDVGSVKGQLVQELNPVFRQVQAEFIGSHPMAGSEKMGVSAARPDLFERAVCVVTPGPDSAPASIERIETLWRSVGGLPLRLAPDVHDEIVARSSHLPHVLAAHLASAVLDPKARAEQRQLCANGFRDSTRIASGSPEMWRDIVVMNRKHVARALGEFSASLTEFQAILERNDAAELENFFRKAKSLRDSWAAQCSSPSPE